MGEVDTDVSTTHAYVTCTSSDVSRACLAERLLGVDGARLRSGDGRPRDAALDSERVGGHCASTLQRVRCDAFKLQLHSSFHPSSNSLLADTWLHDIALVRVAEPLPVDEGHGSIGKVRLPSDEFGSVDHANIWPREEDFCIVKGWGCTASGDPACPHLFHVVIEEALTCSGVFLNRRPSADACARSSTSGRRVG